MHDLHRETFFFPSRGATLHGSLFAAQELSRPVGVVICNSWGAEFERCDGLQRMLATGMPRLGGAGMVFDYPGHGSSSGHLSEVSLVDLSAAACAAVEEASRRCPEVEWNLVGLLSGAFAACFAWRRMLGDMLLLVQPVLRSASIPDHPFPANLAGRTQEVDALLATTLNAFDGYGAVVFHESPKQTYSLPKAVDRIEVPGTWRLGSRTNASLAWAAVDWLDRRTPTAAAPR